MENETKIPLFRRFVIQNFPYIEQDFDALTDYQLISKIVELLNQVITSQNNLVDDMNDLETAFNTLKDYVDHYFDNLDVQEEINNKLDQMVEDGELTQLIAQFLTLNAVMSFPSISAMKLAENLVNGSTVETYGFYAINDGGGAKYRVRTITNEDTIDEITIIALHDNTLVAELVPEDMMSVKQFGAKGDGTTDDTAKIQKAIDKVSTIRVPSGTYMVDPETHINLNDNNTLLLDNDAIIKAKPTSNGNYRVIDINDVDNITIKGGCISGDKNEHTGATGEWGHCIHVRGGSTNLTISDISLINGWGDGLALQGCSNVDLRNLLIDGNRRNGITISDASNLYGSHIVIKNTAGTLPEAGIDFEPNENTEKLENIVLEDISSYNNNQLGYVFSLQNLDATSTPVSVTMNNIYEEGTPIGLRIGKSSTVTGYITVNNINLINNATNAIEFRNAEYNANFFMTINKPTINRTVTGSGASTYASILCQGVNGNGNIKIINSSITVTSANTIYDFYAPSVHNLSIINPIRKHDRISAQSADGIRIIDEYEVYAVLNPNAGGTIGGSEYRSKSIKASTGTSDTTVTLSGASGLGYECVFGNRSSHNYSIQLASEDYCRMLNASAGALITIAPYSSVTLKKVADHEFEVTNLTGTVTASV